jgi:chorismate synthase
MFAHMFFFFAMSFLQKTVTRDGQEVELRGKGRHDPCVLPRAVPMVEAMVALTLVDHLMMQQAQCELFPNEAAVEDLPNPMGTTAHRDGGPAPAREMEEVGGAPVSQRIDEE